MADYAVNQLTPSVVHGVAAPPSFLADFGSIVAKFAVDGDAAAAQSALRTAACKAGIATCP